MINAQVFYGQKEGFWMVSLKALSTQILFTVKEPSNLQPGFGLFFIAAK
jgi:hypothetical protein